MPPRAKPPAPAPKPNPLRNLRTIQPPSALHRKAVTAKPKRACPNPQCNKPQIEDGVCHNCGTVVDDSNIVAEIQFGESSSGAAVVQGSFVGADQGASRTMGPAFRRAGGGENDKEATLREGRRIMQALANQLSIQESVVGTGVQIFKLASMNNFIQGRRTDMVAAVCLYSACRKEKPCRVMLIDFSDKIQVNVFKLSAVFRRLHKNISLAGDGLLPVIPEDLVWRFAAKLEFGSFTHKVAEDAIRLVQRMSLDWMVMGRRPSGVCGACLILAARMNNFRRTITEVVYIVKVTTHTIQKRLDEFKRTPSSALTVEEFLNNEFLESAHDPPSFYEQSEEFLREKAKKREERKRKRKGKGKSASDEDDSSDDENEESANKKRKTGRSGSGSSPPEGTPVSSTELRRDADGFVIPAAPTRNDNIDPRLLEEAIEIQSGTSFDKLVEQFGDEEDPEEEVVAEVANRKGPGRPKGPAKRVQVPEGWSTIEEEMEREISEMVSDPHSTEHAVSYAKAKKRARYHLLLEAANNPQKHVSMDAHIGEDEFADDPEVINCVLPEAEAAKKEKVWVNANKDYLRREQMKAIERRKAANGPPKATRNRKKKPRIGEGQTSAASTPAEAAVSAIKARQWSKKINYEAIADIFSQVGTRSGPGSAATSRMSSRAGSVVRSLVDEDGEGEGEEGSEEDVGAGTGAAGEEDWRKNLGGSDDYDEDDDVGYDEDEGMGMGDMDEDDLYN